MIYLLLLGLFVFLGIYYIKREQKPPDPMNDGHPAYIADPGGLFGAPPRLGCHYCKAASYELFHGCCRKCADEYNVPKKTLQPQDFHDQMNNGHSVVSSDLKGEIDNESD